MASFNTAQYVIQRHSYSGFDHFDLMLEWPGMQRLRTFQVPDEPTPLGLRLGLSCREIAPHRREYLSFEGEVSRGRGSVAIWDRGEADVYSFGKERVELRLRSQREREHARTWYLFFTGGCDWFLVSANFPRP